MSNQITAYFKGRTGVAEPVYQNDYGMVLNFDGIYLPSNFDCHFSVLGSDTAIPGVGADNRVAIPNTVLSHEGNVTVHIPLHTGSDDSEVEYVVYFKVIGRARPEDDGTPVQMTAIEKALALLSQPITNIEEIVNEALSFTGETFDEMRSDLQGDYDTFTSGVNDNISDMQEDIAGFKTEIRGDISDVESDFDNLSAQFQTAIGAVTVDDELLNVRVGADNVTYTSAGEAVRTQFSNVKSALNGKLSINSKVVEGADITESQISFPNIGKLNTSAGEIMASETAYKTTDFINLEDVTGIYRTGTTVRFALWIYCFYDADHNFLGYKGSDSYTDYTIEAYDGKQVTWLDIDGYANAKYIRISKDDSRPYTYWSIVDRTTYKFDVPHITVNNIEPLKFYKKTIVNFGDSLFGNFRDTNNTTDKSISKMIADSTGATVYNCGFGGCRMSYHSQYWRAFSMYALADAITTNTWTDQDAAITAHPSGMPSYFADTLALLKSIDFEEVDYITIGYGTNDYTGDIFIDARSGLEEYQYFKGALEYSLRKILTTYPHIRIVVITPCWRWFLADGVYSYSSDDAASVNTRGSYLYNYVEAIKEVCEKVHVPYIDTYYTLGFNEWTHLEYFPANDGTHMNQAGRQLRADRIVGQMNELF